MSRKKAQTILSQYGECDIAINGTEALEAFRLAHEEGRPYDLIAMDILMPDMDGKPLKGYVNGKNPVISSNLLYSYQRIKTWPFIHSFLLGLTRAWP